MKASLFAVGFALVLSSSAFANECDKYFKKMINYEVVASSQIARAIEAGDEATAQMWREDAVWSLTFASNYATLYQAICKD